MTELAEPRRRPAYFGLGEGKFNDNRQLMANPNQPPRRSPAAPRRPAAPHWRDALERPAAELGLRLPSLPGQ